MKQLILGLLTNNPAAFITEDFEHLVILHWIQDNARFTALCTALLLITGIILTVVLLRRQRKLKRQLDELTLLLKEKKEENPEN